MRTYIFSGIEHQRFETRGYEKGQKKIKLFYSIQTIHQKRKIGYK